MVYCPFARVRASTFCLSVYRLSFGKLSTIYIGSHDYQHVTFGHVSSSDCASGYIQASTPCISTTLQIFMGDAAQGGEILLLLGRCKGPDKRSIIYCLGILPTIGAYVASRLAWWTWHTSLNRDLPEHVACVFATSINMKRN